ncbi:MAG: hypothetical protein AAGF35_10325 [Pseudomonadota bacterium]
MKKLILIALLSPMVYASDDEGYGAPYSVGEEPILTEESLEEVDREAEARPGTAIFSGPEDADVDDGGLEEEYSNGVR